MTKPTREEVKIMRNEAFDWLGPVSVATLDSLVVAYFAQEEELKEERDKSRKLHDICVFSEQTTRMLLEHSRKLEAENQALKRKGELLCCQAGVLEMENQALKAEREKDIQDAINEYRGDQRC